jgi:hypothetical protein
MFTWGELFIDIACQISIGNTNANGIQIVIASKIAGPLAQKKQFSLLSINNLPFASIATRLAGWGLIAMDKPNWSLTQYGGNQCNLLMKAEERRSVLMRTS